MNRLDSKMHSRLAINITEELQREVVTSKLTSMLFILLIFISSCKDNEASCNGEGVRRDVKIAIDDASSEINLSPDTISVTEIGDLDVGEINRNSPRQATEKKVYQITAKVEKLSKHRDGDWKVKLRDYDKYINCESPNPDCEYAQESSFHTEFVQVRNWLVDNEEGLVGKTVTIVGIGFIDIDHVVPRNAADNEMELHPVLSISF